MTSNEITHRQAKALAALVHELRGDWDAPGVLDAIGQARTRGTAADVAIATIRAATAASNRTPAVIPLDGNHWREKVTTEPAVKATWRPPRKDETCPVHVGSWLTNCSGCAADQAAGDTTAPADPHRPPAAEARALVRAELAQITAQLCRHRVDRARVRCGVCDRTPTSQETTA